MDLAVEEGGPGRVRGRLPLRGEQTQHEREEGFTEPAIGRE